MKKLANIILNADSLIGRLLLSVVYIFIYDLIYKDFICFYFSYLGIEYIQMSVFHKALWIIFSVFPFIFYHGINNISSFLCFFLYLFVYIPFIHSLFITWGLGFNEIIFYAIIMCIFFISYFCIGQKHSIKIFKDIRMYPTVRIQYIEIITLIITLIFIIFRAGSMHFVNIFTQIDVLYDLRQKNSEEIGGLSFILYLQGWLFGAFYPFLLVYYLKNKHWFKSILILLGYFALFLVDMQKMTFLMPFFLIGLYYLIKTKEKVIFNRLHSFMLISISIISIILYFLRDNDAIMAISSLILLRTTCVTGWLSQLYIHFFQNNPFTYYSHISLINAITASYPYSDSIGRMVAYGTQNANANFFLIDGLAACGILGVIIIGLIFLIMLHFINAISYRYKKSDLFVVFLPTLSYLLNASLFTTLLSYGLFILILILLCTNNSLEENNKNE